MKPSTYALLSAVLLGSTIAHAQESRPLIREIRVDVDGDTDLPRVLELLSIKEGDRYAEAELERGLIRLTDSGKFIGLRARFDSSGGVLQVDLTLIPRVAVVEPVVKGASTTALSTELASEIVDVAGLSPGDPIAPDQVSGVRDRVLTRLRDRGFRSAQSIVVLEQRDDAAGLAVRIAVDLGARSQIVSLRTKGFGEREIKELFSRLEVSAQKTPARKDGEQTVYALSMPFDLLHLDEVLGAWGRDARARGYYDFQMRSEEESLDGGYELTLDLQVGPRYDIQFTGNVAFWERDLRAKALDRTLRLGVPFSLQEAETIVTSEYAREGYTQMMLKTKIDDKGSLRVVRFNVVEGQRQVIGQVRLVGVAEREAEALDRVVHQWINAYKSPVSKLPFDERFVRAELPTLLAHIRSLGYLDARLLDYRTLARDGGAVVDLEIPVQLGDRYTVRSVIVTGNSVMSQAELEKIIEFGPGSVADPASISAMSDRIARAYRDLGFVGVKVSDDLTQIMKRVPESSVVDVEYLVDQGPMVKVGSAFIDGLHRVKEGVVLREFGSETLHRGGLWTSSGADLLEQRLLNLGVFSSVSFEPVGGQILQRGSADGTKVEIQEKDLKITLVERPAGSFEFGPGFRNDRGIIGSAELNYRNLGGWNRSAQFRSQISRKLEGYRFLEQNHSITYIDPYLAEWPLLFRANAIYDISDQHVGTGAATDFGYSSRTARIGFDIEKQITRRLRWVHNLFSLAFTREFDVVNNPDAAASEQREQASFRVGTIGSSLLYDRRDNVFNPTRGWNSTSSIEISSPVIGSRALDQKNLDVNFAKFHQDFTLYLPGIGEAVIATSLAYTRLWTLGDTVVPQISRPALGGDNSIRSLRQGELQFPGSDIGDQSAYEATIEYRQPIYGSWEIAYFMDMAEIDASSQPGLNGGNKYKVSTRLRTGLGLGLRYRTIVGPLAVNFAYNTNPARASSADAEPAFRFSLTLGSF